MQNSIRINPRLLYPLVSIESIDPQLLSCTVDKFNTATDDFVIQVLDFQGYYFILDGVYEALAASILNRAEVEISIVDRDRINFWGKDENVIGQLRAIGMNAVYDFEALGGFKYASYPSFYREGE